MFTQLLHAVAVSAVVAGPVGTIVICDHIQDPPTLDPQKEFADKNHTIVQQIYEGLLRLNSEGKLEPALARAWRRMDERTMEFFLRSGVIFQNGEPFDGESVRVSLERYLDPKTGFPALGFIDTIEGVEVVDPLTVRIRTRGPDGLLLYRLAAFVLMIPPKYLRENGPAALSERPVGTGAFKFVAWNKGRSIELEANPTYWMAGFPKIHTLIFRFLPTAKQIPALLSGEVDVITDIPGTKTQEIARSGIARVVKKPLFYTIGATFNISEGPLKDLRVRRALNYAIDREDLIRYDQLGNALPTVSLTMPEEHGHALNLEPYAYNPQKAKDLLRQAGYPSGLTLRALVEVEAKRAAMILERHWQRVGITLRMFWTDNDKILEDLRARKTDLALGGCPDPMASAYFIPSIYLYSKSPYSLTRSPEFDALLEHATKSTDSEDLAAALRDLDRFVHDQALSLFTYQRVSAAGVRLGVQFQPSVTRMPYLYGISLKTGNASGP